MQLLPGQGAQGCSQPPKEPQHLQNPPPKTSGEHRCAPQHGQEPGTEAMAGRVPGSRQCQGSQGITGSGHHMNGSCPGDPHDLFGIKNGSWAPWRAVHTSVMVQMELVPWLAAGRAQTRPQPGQGEAQPRLWLPGAAPASHQHTQHRVTAPGSIPADPATPTPADPPSAQPRARGGF